MVRYKKRAVPKLNENRDLTFEPSSDLNSDLGDSSSGFNPRRTRYTTNNPQAYDAVKMLNIAKRDIQESKLLSDTLHLPPIY